MTLCCGIKEEKYRKHHLGKLSNVPLLSSCHCFITVEKAFSILIHMRLSFSERRTGQQNPIFFLSRPFAMCGNNHQQPTSFQKTKVLVHSTQLPNSFSQNDEHL